MREREQLYADLRKYGLTIGVAAHDGNEVARRVIRAYEMHHAAPNDPGAFALCNAALDEWLRPAAVAQPETEA